MLNPVVLLADDHPLFRLGVKNALMSLQISEHVLEAGDGREVLEIESKHSIDLFVLDYRMPYLNGYELASLLLRKNPFTKILVLTMYSDPPLILSLMKLGIRGFLLKTSSIDDFGNAIRTVLQGEIFIEKSLSDRIRSFEREEFVTQFTDRERELVRLLGKGLTSKHIAIHFGIASKSVEVFRSRLLNKVGVKNTSELLRYAYNNGVVSYEDSSHRIPSSAND